MMFGISVSLAAVWTNVAVLAVAGIINFAAVSWVRRIYELWGIPEFSYRLLGLIEIVAALCLANPSLRGWGVALAAPIMFGSVVMLLDRDRYLFALGAMVPFMGLGAVLFGMLFVPGHIHYVPTGAQN